MKRTLATLVLVLSAVLLSAQTSKRSVPPADAECGAAGCMAPNPTAPLAIESGSPVIIRSGREATTGTAQVPAAVQAPEASTARPFLPSPPTDFEQFVQDSLGHPLPIFGSQLFRNGGGSFTPSTGALPPADYVLGTGDEVLIRTWGKVDIDARATVDRGGQIFLPRVGMLTVAGLRLDQLSDFLRAAIAHQFTGFEISVSLGQLRSIQIFVLGQARAPGAYTISSLSTLVNALFLSGGPASTGSTRDIEVKRDGAVITHFDLYSLLLSGDKSGDVHLLPGDIIFIPVTGAQIALDGSINTPAIYEIKPGATVANAIDDAGGLTPMAGTARAVLEHVLDRSRRSIEEFALDAKGLSIALKSGDVLRILPISPRITDAVTLRGNVSAPGRYAWHAGMRISDLIPSREALLTRDYYNRKNAPNLPEDARPFGVTPATDAAVVAGDAPLAGMPPKTDDVTERSPELHAARAPVTTDVTERSPELHAARAPSTTAVPAVASHETEINWNYATIERLDPIDLTTHLVPFALGEAVAAPASPENKSLQAGDVIVVYSQKDMALPLELQAKFVRIDGQVKAPGIYRVGQSETLRDLVLRAGGIVPRAYLYAAKLTRESVRLDQVAKLHALVEEESREVLSPAATRQTSVGTSATTSSDLELRKAYITELGKAVPDGRVVLQLHPDAMTAEDVPDLLLEDGDHFYVPATPNTIEVLGNVYNQGALRYLGQVPAREYLNAAGGPTREGDRKREFIIRADGTVISRQAVPHLEKMRMFPGDSVVVPPKLRSGYTVIDILGLSQIITSLGLVAVALR